MSFEWYFLFYFHVDTRRYASVTVYACRQLFRLFRLTWMSEKWSLDHGDSRPAP